MEVHLNPRLAEEHQRLLIQYIEMPRMLSRAQWRELLYALDLLRTSVVVWEGKVMTFSGFYERVVNERFLMPFLMALAQHENVEMAGGQLTAVFSREIQGALEEIGLKEPLPIALRLLLVHCLYWWASFAKGYILEMAIFRDLEQSGIQFHAHDLFNHEERLASYDLVVSGQKGDVKSSTYFLEVSRSFPLHCAFYIARAFDTIERRWIRLVLLKRWAWNEIDGETIFGMLEQVFGARPVPVEIEICGERLVVINYEEWKQRIRRYQTERGE
jgi:hypothetical protein